MNKTVFDGRITLRDILPLALVITGFVALHLQYRSTRIAEKELTVKVEDLNAVILALKEEESARRRETLEGWRANLDVLSVIDMGREENNTRDVITRLNREHTLYTTRYTAMSIAAICQVLLKAQLVARPLDREIVRSVIELNDSLVASLRMSAVEIYQKGQDDDEHDRRLSLLKKEYPDPSELTSHVQAETDRFTSNRKELLDEFGLKIRASLKRAVEAASVLTGLLDEHNASVDD